MSLLISTAAVAIGTTSIPPSYQGHWFPAKADCALADPRGTILIHDDSIVDASTKPETAQFQYIVDSVRVTSKRRIEVYSVYMEEGNEEGLIPVSSRLTLGSKGQSLSIHTYDEESKRHRQLQRARYRKCS